MKGYILASLIVVAVVTAIAFIAINVTGLVMTFIVWEWFYTWSGFISLIRVSISVGVIVWLVLLLKRDRDFHRMVDTLN